MKNIHKKFIAAIIGATTLFSGLNLAANAAEFEKWTVNASTLNCRAEPNMNGAVITKYNRGKVVSVIGCDGGWLQTYDGSIQGWCYGKYLKPYGSSTVQSNGTSAGKHLGNFKISYYTCSPSENGGGNRTSRGHRLTDVVGECIAVDPKVIPYGTRVYIEGIGYRTAMDCGGAIKGKKIDVLVRSKKDIPRCGVHYCNVYLAN